MAAINLCKEAVENSPEREIAGEILEISREIERDRRCLMFNSLSTGVRFHHFYWIGASYTSHHKSHAPSGQILSFHL